MRTPLKQLQTRLAQKKGELTLLEQDSRLLNGKANKIRGEIAELNHKIKLATKQLTLTEHAILRYIERVMGVNVEEVRSKILTDKLKKLNDEIGDGEFHLDGFKVIVKENVITTIVV